MKLTSSIRSFFARDFADCQKPNQMQKLVVGKKKTNILLEIFLPTSIFLKVCDLLFSKHSKHYDLSHPTDAKMALGKKELLSPKTLFLPILLSGEACFPLSV